MVLYNRRSQTRRGILKLKNWVAEQLRLYTLIREDPKIPLVKPPEESCGIEPKYTLLTNHNKLR